MTKQNIIDQVQSICHPSTGIDAGLSWYVGGMRDTGAWHEDELRKLEEQELLEILSEGISTQEAVKERAREFEREINSPDYRAPEIVQDSKTGIWHTKAAVDEYKKFIEDRDLKIWEEGFLPEHMKK